LEVHEAVNLADPSFQFAKEVRSSGIAFSLGFGKEG
jgi:hypothetical protein